MAGPAFDPTTVDTSAVDRLAKIVTGTQNLNTAPDLVGALANGNATPQQAQAIDQYMGALRASQRVRLAQTTGAKVNFTEWEKVQLDQLGIQYGAVEYTSELRNADLIKTATSAGLVAKTDKDGNFVGAITAEQDKQERERKLKEAVKADDGGWLNPIAAIKSGGGAVLGGLNKSWNYVSGSVADGAEGLVNNVKDLAGGGANNPSQGANFTSLAAAQDREDATTAGYDPDNPWSMMAYKASGKAYNDTYDIERDYGTDQVSAAKQYLVDPQKFLQSAVADNDADTAANVLTQVNSPEFQDVVRRVASRHAGIGTLVATNLGIDPVEHSRSYMLTAAGVELAAAFALDPTNAVFAGVKAVKAAQIGINGIGDAEKIARTLDTANTAFYAQRVQRGAQSFLDEAKIIREAAPDSLEAAQAFARINARTPGFVQLLPDVQGVRRIDNIAGTPNRQGLREVYGVKPIESLDELSDYLASKGGMLRITTGQAAVEGSLMPGAISRAGYRQIRAAMASGSTARSFRITEKNAGKFMPSETDAVAMLGRNGAELTPAELAAAGEGSRRGEAAYTAQARSPLAKMRRSAARMTNFLPTDTRFVLSDPASIEKVRRYGGMYLSKYDRNSLAAQFSRADDGARLAILRGMEMQTLHAAGAGHTEAGRRLIDDVAAARNERYGLIDDKLPDGTGSQRSYAIHEYQVTDDFNLPNFRELRKVLAKANVWGYTGGRVLESQVVDEAMSLIKIGWLTTGTNLVRNTGEAWTNVILRGEGRATAAAKAAAGEAGGLASRTALVERLASMPGLPMMGRMVRAMAKAGADDDVLKYIALKAERDGGRAQQRFSEIHTRSYTHQAEDVDTITRAGFGATQGRWKAAGKVITDTDSAVGAERMAENFSRMVGSNSNFIRLVMQAVRAEGTPRVGALRETRAAGVQFHGAREPIQGDLSAGFYNENNIYGGAETFYTTDAVDVAAGYGRRNPNAVVYRIDETKPVKFFDMENQLDGPELLKLFGVGADDTGRHANFIRDAVDSALQAWGGKANLRQAMDEARDISKMSGVSKDGVQDAFDAVSHNLQRAGYGGMRHKGGLKTGAREHEVKIYLQPQDQIKLTLHTPEREVLPPSRDAALADVRKHMDTWMPGVWEKARRASVFRDGDGVAQQAVTAEEKVLAKQQQVEAIVEDWRAHLLKSDGTLSTKLIDEIERTGTAPNGAWITANIPDAERPLHTLKADWEPVVPDNKVAGIVGQLSDMAGVGYQKLVQGPIDRMSTSPIFYHQYGLARKGAEGLEKRWISEGMHAETADNILDSWAESVAMQKVFQRTDNPELKTQLDIVGRNFFAFSRATQDFIRRWGSTFIEDPGRLRRAQLTLDAAVSGGIVWTDPTTGNKNFTFPGTGPLIDGLTGLGRRLNLPFVPEIPTSSGMSGRVVFLQPGLQNPAQMSLTPIVNIPMRALMRMLPDNAGMMNELRIQMQHADMLLNGEQGYGKGAVDQLLPSAVKKLADATDDDRDGMLASASKEALAALLATGNYDDPMDDNQKQRFLDDVKIQTRNQLILRAIVGFWAPAPPSLTQEGFDENVDPSYQLLGVQTLHDEFKVILDDAKGDKGKAVAIWAKLHPDKLVYTVAGSEGTTKGAYLPATADTNAWMEENLGWMKDYTNVSAYFIPPATSDDFDMLAWRTQLQLGLRQNKTLEGWYEDAATINAETQYYAEYNTYQQDLTDAQLKGDKDLADQLKGQFASWKQDFYAVNPLFKEKQGDYGRSVVNAQHQLDSLRRLTTDGSAPAEVQQVLPGLADIIAAYDEHKRFAAETEGNTKAAVADRAAEKARYVAYVSGVAESDPALTAVFNGVFRYLDTDMEKVGG